MPGSEPLLIAPEREDDEAASPPQAQANRAAAPGFPHKKVRDLWDARIKYAQDADKQNEIDYSDAENWFRGGDRAASDPSGDSPDGSARDSKFTSNRVYGIVTRLVSFMVHQNAKVICAPLKGPALKPFAKATEKLADKAAYEKGYHEQKKKAFVEAILRNHGFVRQGWDHYDWLPVLEWPDGEVRLDPDCGGDETRAGFMVEEVKFRLDDLLEDDEIPEEIREELKDNRDLHHLSRTSPSKLDKDSEQREKEERVWDKQPGLRIVNGYRIWSRIGLLPGIRDPKGDDSIESVREKPMPTTRPFGQGRLGFNPNAYHVPPVRSTEAPPEAQTSDPFDHGRRVYILMVEGFPKVLKVTDWPMDHYRRDEFPYVQIRLSDLPGDLHGVPFIRAIRPLIVCFDRFFATWVNDKRHGARRIIEADENIHQTELDKIERGSNWEVIKVPQIGNSIRVTEFGAKDQSYVDLLPALKDMIDNATGDNDVFRGAAGSTQKTATEAEKLYDNTAAALGYLEDAIELFEEKVARKTVAALHRYVPRESTYPGCRTCGVKQKGGARGRGPGLVSTGQSIFNAMTGAPEPEVIPCPACGILDEATGQMAAGTGWDAEAFAAGRAIVKGADFWLTEDDAAAWREDLSVEQIRASILVGIKPGSSRRDYREREVARLRDAGQDIVPFLQALPPTLGIPKWLAYVKEVAETTGIAEPEKLLPTEEEIQAALMEQQQAAMAAEQAKVPMGPPPEEMAAKNAAEQQKAQAQAMDFAHRREMEMGKLDIERRRLAIEEVPQQRGLAMLDQHMAMMAESRAQEQAEREARGLEQAAVTAQVVETVAALAQAVSGIQAAAVAVTAASEQIVAAAQALQTVAAAPKRCTAAKKPNGDWDILQVPELSAVPTEAPMAPVA